MREKDEEKTLKQHKSRNFLSLSVALRVRRRTERTQKERKKKSDAKFSGGDEKRGYRSAGGAKTLKNRDGAKTRYQAMDP